ncbi:ATPase AAA [Arsukibacterium sp. MJ3]|uniref:IS21-like element helper ATPase IstB n=1 Tax=Arsukibacterium sp. MJ3 TaxID=1632859 RepID=UPI00062734F8|nr:IS21-like element helper ATPase IstB [Arsukibacterium sp. MJ3]KKO48027.1 ATPase AAA [Arsukibacterium sp. MJ3]
MDNLTASLPLMLKQLRLGTMVQQWNALGKKAIKEQWSPQQYLSELCHIELATRDDKRLQRLLKDAKLPVGKSLGSFDFNLVEGVSKHLVADLINQPRWLKLGGNILLFGASGLGKTHIASSIGYGLVEQGHHVKFIAASAIVQQLQQAKQHLRLQDELLKLDKYSLLIVDDIGYVRKTEQETSVLFELIAHRYERHSMIITSNTSFDQWDELFDGSTMTIAAIDRLVHHATIIHCEGESYRRKAALSKGN